MVSSELNKFRDELLTARSRLISRIHRAASEARENMTQEALDLVDNASLSLSKSLSSSVSSFDRRMLQLIEEALSRFDDLTYGDCRACGNPIGERRLRAIPWARHCITCQELEEEGVA